MKKKKNLIWLLALVLLIFQTFDTTIAFAEASTEGDVVYIPDENLRQVLFNSQEFYSYPTLFRPSTLGRLTKSDLAIIETIDIRNKNVKSLEGLQYCTKLETLYAYNNEISDVSPLSNLEKLSYVSLSHNKISDISPIKGLKYSFMGPGSLFCSSQRIDIYTESDTSDITLNNPIKCNGTLDSISDISNNGSYDKDSDTLKWTDINKDTTLSFKFHKTRQDLDPQFGPNYYVTTLSFSGTVYYHVKYKNSLIHDENLTNAILDALGKDSDYTITKEDLESITDLSAENKEIKSIEGLELCKNLKTLNLSNNEISDITPLTDLTNLEDLNLNNNKISSISSLSKLNKLNSLSLDNQKIDLPFENIKDSLTIENPIKDLENKPVVSISTISNNGFYAADNNSINWTGLKDNVTLSFSFEKNIDIGNASAVFNGVVNKSISILPVIPDENLKNALLKALNKSPDYTLTKKDLKGISNLNLSSNNIKSVSGLEYCTDLYHLDLSNNEISDVAPLTKIAKLGSLNLSGNRIDDISPLNMRVPEHFEADDQTINIDCYTTDNSLTIKVPVIGFRGRVGENQYSDSIKDISNGGIFNKKDDTITWTDIGNCSNLSFKFSCGIEFCYRNQSFSGTVNVNVKHKPSLFRDNNLEKVILNALGKGPDYIITKEDLQSITSLYAVNQNIKSVEGLENCTNLHTLNLSDNKISDISPLADLNENLTWLDLDNNEISNISPLSKLKNLNALTVSNNKILDISSLGNLKNLKSLYIYGNNISDVLTLKDLTQLEELSIAYNKVNDISPISSLTNLKNLYVNHNEISNISPLTNFKGLEMLSLADNDITDISSITELTKMKILYLHNNKVSNIAPLKNLTKLTELSLGNNKISDLSPLAPLTNIETLYLYGNEITDISPLSNLINLKTLDLSNNKITDFSPINSLTNLEKVKK